MTLRQAAWRLTLLSIGIKLGYLALAFALGVVHWADSWTAIVGIFHRWDAGWYAKIATQGYETVRYAAIDWDWTHQYSHAFFPLFPYSVRVVMGLTGWGFDAAGLLLLTILGPLQLLGVYAGLRSVPGIDWRWAWGATWAFALLPFQFYNQVLLSEPMFVLCLGWGMWSLAERRWPIFLICAMGLVLGRAIGILMGLPLVGLWWATEPRVAQPPLLVLVGPILTVVAVAGVVFWHLHTLCQHTGDWFAFSTVQQAWGIRWTVPFGGLFRYGGWVRQLESFYVLVLTAVGIWGLRGQPYWLRSVLWLHLLLIVSQKSESIFRYASVWPPIWLAAAAGWQRWAADRGLLRVLLLAAAIAVHYLSWAAWLYRVPFY